MSDDTNRAALSVAEEFRVPAHLQWKALSGRTIRAAVRDGDLPFGFAAPMIFFLCFYVPLRRSMEAGGLDYAQYLLPVIVLQGMFFTAMSAGDRAARDTFSGMGTRLRSMPVRPWVPMAARMSANLVRAVVAIAGALVIGYVFGFRFHDPAGALGFALLALAFAAAVVIGADTLGVATGKPEIGASALLAPQLLLIMMSTGFVPAQAFPGWIQPFVRNQPVSQAAAALRGLADGEFPAAVAISAVWCAALIVAFAALSVLVERRRP
ncbi:ABC transporter permease [Nocardia sp. CDC153]|uniref:ABC transporter permease n=1 Tax=Nocardia sp. CDC153 TaxID=3112167 RepID=UPI002DBE8296|nr:ABC transporter permease [Nocardia sp. CDC153]MEC3955092.1 ABC transporter permease [Nocardia sp. CDC153]